MGFSSSRGASSDNLVSTSSSVGTFSGDEGSLSITTQLSNDTLNKEHLPFEGTAATFFATPVIRQSRPRHIMSVEANENEKEKDDNGTEKDDTGPPLLHSHNNLYWWFQKKNRFWLEPHETNQKGIIGSKVQHLASTHNFILTNRSQVDNTSPTPTILDMAYTFVVPRDLMLMFLVKFKNPKFYRSFRAKASKLGNAPGTIFLVYDDVEKKKLFDGVGETFFHWYFYRFFVDRMSKELSRIIGCEVEFTVQCTHLMTNKSSHQSPHVDEDGVRNLPWRRQQWIIHIPLCSEGRVLRVWDRNISNSQHFGVPFGSALVLPASQYHAGCYCRSPGNLGLVVKFTPAGGAPSIAKLQRPLAFSPLDAQFNTDHEPDRMHSKVYQDFHGYSKFSTAYLKQVRSFSPVPLDDYLFENAPLAVADNSDRKRTFDDAAI
jgi:hypothetical protein